MQALCKVQGQTEKAQESVAEKVTVPEHQLYLDLSKVTVKSGTSGNVPINQDNWKVMVCEATEKKFNDFTVTKSEMVECTCTHLNMLKLRNILFGTYDWTPLVRIKSW